MKAPKPLHQGISAQQKTPLQRSRVESIPNTITNMQKTRRYKTSDLKASDRQACVPIEIGLVSPRCRLASRPVLPLRRLLVVLFPLDILGQPFFLAELLEAAHHLFCALITTRFNPNRHVNSSVRSSKDISYHPNADASGHYPRRISLQGQAHTRIDSISLIIVSLVVLQSPNDR